MLVAARMRTSTLMTRAAAQPRELLVLQNVQQLGLQRRRHLADFVEQDRAFVAQFELARLGVRRSGKCSRLVAEQFALQQIGGNGRAIYFQERAVRARREFVNQARQHFFAGAALAQQQYRNIHIARPARPASGSFASPGWPR